MGYFSYNILLFLKRSVLICHAFESKHRLVLRTFHLEFQKTDFNFLMGVKNSSITFG
jgi:hypothetical protein